MTSVEVRDEIRKSARARRELSAKYEQLVNQANKKYPPRTAAVLPWSVVAKFRVIKRKIEEFDDLIIELLVAFEREGLL